MTNRKIRLHYLCYEERNRSDMNFLNNKTLFLSVCVMVIGLVMIIGTSYSVVINFPLTDDNYSLKVGNVSVDFINDENKILLSNSFPISDKEALNGGEEFSFSVTNSGNYTANYSLSIEETSTTLIGEVIRFSYNINDTGYNIASTLSENNIINQNMVLEVGKTDSYKMKFWIKEEAGASYMGKIFSAKLVLNTTQNDYKYASSVIEKLGQSNLDGVSKMNNKNDIEYRYTGTNPNNYVWFNCHEGYTKGEEYCEKWQIIGSINNTWENGLGIYKTLKIVRNSPVDKVTYFNNKYNTNNNSSLINYANNTYYNTLSLSAKNLILNAKWNVGTLEKSNSVGELYLKEASDNRYLDVATISPSDYLYIGTDNWLYSDNLITLNGTSDNCYIVNDNNVIEGDNNQEYNFIPSVFLKPDVSIIGGYGTIDNPYEIGIKFPMSYGTIDIIK